MNRNSIRWRLPASYAVIALLAALSLGSFMLLALRSYYADQEHRYLIGNAIALQPVLEEIVQSDVPVAFIRDQINGLAFLSRTQIRLIDSNGNMIADSGIPTEEQFVAVSAAGKRVFPVFESGPAEPPESRMSTVIYVNNSEFASNTIPFNQEIPFSGPAPEEDIILSVSASPYGYGFVSQSDFDPTHRSSQIVGVPLSASDGRKLGSLEFSNGPNYGADVISSVTGAWLLASVFAIVIAALAGLFVSKRVTRPVLELESATRQMEQGDLSVRVDLQGERQQEFVSLANSFNGMAHQVEQTVSTLRAFIADAAHELHTPLTALQTNIELARDADAENASARTLYLSRAQEQAQRLEALVKSLLDLSRIESVQSNRDVAALELNRLVNEISEHFASRAEQSDRSFALELPVEPITVGGNEMQVKQVVANLLENALKFTPKNGTILLTVQRVEEDAQLTISDTGIGISPDDLPHMFERFHRGRNAFDYAGNGLGLAIVKAIVESHGGHVEAQSHGVDKGSTFIVKLPIDKTSR